MSDTILGTDGTKDITINRQDMRESVYAIGRSGSGKTSFLENMIVQDMQNGYGVLVMEPHGDLLNKIINHVPEERLKDVYLFDPVGETAFPFGLNPFACRDTQDLDTFTQTLENVQNIFTKVFEMSHATPRLRQFVRNICLTMIGSGYAMTEIPNLLLDKSFRDRVPKYPGTELFWKTYDSLPPREQAERSESTLDRIDDLITSPIIRNIIGQVQSIDFSEILAENKIVLVKLDSAKEDLTSLLGSIIVSQLLSAVINRRNLPERRRRQFHVYLDEFQNFSSQSIAKLLAEGRKFGVGCILSHQFKAQLDLITQGATSQVGSLVVFNVSREDADILSGAFNTRPGEIEKTIPRDIFRYLPHHKNDGVKWFYHNYIKLWLDAAGKHEKIRREVEQSRDILGPVSWDVEITEYPEAALEPLDDRPSEFNPYTLRKILHNLEDYLYRAMKKRPPTETLTEQFEGITDETILLDPKEKRLRELLELTAPYLGFQYFITHLYPPIELSASELDTYLRNLKPPFSLSKFNLEKIKYDFFIHHFTEFVLGLCDDPILIEVAGNTRQTHADKRGEISNDIVHLPRYTALVRVTSGEYRMTTYEPKPMDSSFPRKFDIIKKQTRAKYCRPRAEVEREIATRVRSADPQPTQRKHTLE